MKTSLYMMALAAMLLPLAGCETLTETPGENRNRMAHTVYTNFLQVPMDVERLLLLDRPTYLSPVPIPQQ